ncbi:MAG: hypothetical protein N2504_03455 [candidate division WOR-3 bacterium]|nr:hypothetical protein [candidate division WOR-3 bacterium]MCX7947625.1 hypothetical protein [candidate division WOR-3 bacterium]MDW8150503.1 hypothetical protein [candidate division WOR-3 bacterium]
MIVVILSHVLGYGVYDVSFGEMCNINPTIARSIIKDVIRNTNVDDFAYIGDRSFRMIIHVLAKKYGEVREEDIKGALSRYCDDYSIKLIEGINR